MSASQKVELGIRAAHLAKSALDLLGTGDDYLAKLQFARIARELKELGEFISSLPAEER